ncbi:ECF transporter S component [Enterococcus sp. LJL128]
MKKFKLSGSPFSIREIAYLSLVIAACVVGRLVFQPLPNVQPMTAIFLIITIQLGLSRGMIVALLSVLITNFYLGMGIWTFSQLLSYFFILLIVMVLSRFKEFRNSYFLQSLFSFLAGFLYGLIISFIDVQVYGMPAFLPYYLQGIPFDFMHGIGNLIFYLILAPVFIRLLQNRMNS